jgi:hypothetical protein
MAMLQTALKRFTYTTMRRPHVLSFQTAFFSSDVDPKSVSTKDMIVPIAERHGISQRLAGDILDQVVEIITKVSFLRWHCSELVVSGMANSTY